MEVLTSIREPYSKNTLWIYPNPIDNNIEIKIFNKGWKVLFTTKDVGLTNESKQQVENLAKELKNVLNFKLNKEYGKLKTTILNLLNKNRELESRINELENKLSKLTKRYGTLLVKTK